MPKTHRTLTRARDYTGSVPRNLSSSYRRSSAFIGGQIALFSTLPALLLMALLSAATAHAALSIMPLKDVRAGMHGTGRTVFNGDKVEDFQVEILGVLE